jgi:hypothetical protein
MRGFGTLCQAGAQNELRVYNTTNMPWSGYRSPEAIRDSVYVFVENNQYKSSDDAWKGGRITNVTSGNVCPGGVAGYTLTISPVVAEFAGATSGAPIRTWELMTLSLYQAGGGDWFLGAQSNSAGENRQPMLGPLVADSGFTLQYLNAAGAQTATPSEVRSIRVTMRGVSDQKVVRGAGTHLEDVTDSLVAQVVLRNALR